MTGAVELEVVAGRAAGATIAVEDELLIGRHASGAGRLDGDDEISRQHARVTLDRSGFCAIEDLGSTNGTLATCSPAAVPRATTVLYVSEGPTMYFWSRATTLTARQVQQNPVVAFAIDGSTEDLNATQGIQGLAECNV